MRRLWVFIVVMLCLFSGCSADYERTEFALDTVVNVTVYGAKNQAVLDDCFAEIERLEALLSATRENSDVARLNAADGQAVRVAQETVDLLTLAARVSSLSDGAFDVTIRPVSKLWNFTADTPVVPVESALTEALALVDYRRVTINGNAVSVEGEIELGGIAKGYIADRVHDVLREHGVRSALIDLGGNIVAVGDKGGKPFRIGIKDPNNTGALAAVLQVNDTSVVTSGSYERGFTLDGVRYHHLLDPKTGMPVQNGLASVTVVCESSALADALSTACFVLGEEKARVLLAAFPEAEALFIDNDGTLSVTDGLQKSNDAYILVQK